MAQTHGEIDELQLAIAARQLAERAMAVALLAFSTEELEALPGDHRKVLDVLFKRRLREGGAEPTVEDSLRIRQQFEHYSQNHLDDPNAARLAAQLRR